jgi:hypothetical protein
MADFKYNSAYCSKAIDILASGESFAAVCAELDICRTTLYEWREKHPEFDAALLKGLQKSQRVWERIGKDGICGDVKNFAGTPWMFVMKNRFRDDYKEDKADKPIFESLIEKFVDRLVE